MARQTLFMRTSKRYSPAHSRRFVALSRQQHRKAVSARQRPRIKGASMGRTLTVRTVLVLGGLALLTACGGNGPMGFKIRSAVVGQSRGNRQHWSNAM